MSDAVYTHAMWRVQEGNEEAFVDAWVALGDTFAALPDPPRWGTLIRSTTDPTLFYSFGPWRSREDVEAMRTDQVAREALERLRRLCTEATPGMYELVRHASVQAPSAASDPGA